MPAAVRGGGGGDLSSSGSDIFGQGGSSKADVRSFWCKNFRFFDIYGVSARTRRGELSQ